MKESAAPEPGKGPEDERTGLPLFRTWGGVYLLVVGTFIVWVVLLNLLTRMFS